jgi:hypothetical protein
MSSIRSVVTGVAVVAATAGTAAALAATGTASAGTAGSGQAGGATALRTFGVVVHHGSESDLDLGKTGFSAGDQDLFTGALTRHGKHVGRLVGSCTTARAGRSSADQLCQFVLRLGRSQINASGTVSAGKQGPGTFVLPIVGGSGRYRRANGQIAVTATSGATFPITVALG